MTALDALAPALAPEPRAAERPEPAARPEPAPPLEAAVGLALVDRLLRDQTTVLARIERGEALGPLARTCVITIAAAAAILGATLGAHRGGLQIAYAAIKLPLVLLLTAGLATPTLTALDAAVGGRADLRRDLATVLAALALAAMLCAATAPIVLLADRLGAGYHDVILLTVACCGAGGLGGFVFFLRALAGRGGPRRLVGGVFLAVCAVVGCQLAWTLRPWVVRPRTVELPFVRAIEGSFLDALGGSLDSARGIYHRDAAPLGPRSQWTPAEPADYTPGEPAPVELTRAAARERTRR